jgi:hypothetical protein
VAALLLLLGGTAVVVAVVAANLLSGTVGPLDKRPLPGPDVTPLPIAVADSLPAGAARVLAAGDIGLCGSPGVPATAAVLDAYPDATVVVLGDNAYPDGSVQDFAACYDPTWGAVKARTWPVAGNHEYETPDAAGHFGYFGAAAGSPETPWQVRELAGWRVYLLDSECGRGRARCSEPDQLAWLRADLAEHPASCILAAWHRPRFSSGPHGSNASVDPMWRILAGAGADIVLAGHDHLYERFAPLDADGRPADGGLRSWVVGTGGGQLYHVRSPLPVSEARWDAAFGVLELDLRPGDYDWTFHAALGEPFEDTGSGSC